MPMSDKKMSGKQAITGGFNLDAFVNGADPAAEMAPRPQKPPQDAREVKKRSSVPSRQEVAVRGKSGLPKQVEERVSERVQLMVSPSELEKIKAEAGLVSVSKFLREYLKEHGLI